MKITFLYTIAVLATWTAATAAFAQSADVSLPKQREGLVESAETLIASRTSKVVLPEVVPNPFEWPAVEEVAGSSESPEESSAANSGLNTAEFLGRLAAQIPATGIAFIGDQGILLLGQKRLKVGDMITISLEGQSYELSIAAITSASFTVKRGGLLHTRPTQITSPTTRNSRP